MPALTFKNTCKLANAYIYALHVCECCELLPIVIYYLFEKILKLFFLIGKDFYMLSRNEYVDNLKRIYVAHKFYKEADESDRERICDACEGLFDKVTARYDIAPGVRGSVSPTVDSVRDSGLDRSFGILLLMYGSWFLKEQFGMESFEDFVANFIL